MLLSIAIALSVIALCYALLRKEPEPLLGIYSQPGKWFYLKKALFFIFLSLRKYRMNRMKNRGENAEIGDAGYGMKSRMTVEDMDCVQTLVDDPMAIDCMYFNGLNAKGDYFLLRIARRQNREAEIWLYINVKDIGFFQSPVHPDTTLYNANSDSFDAGGLRFECIDPMRKWKVTFNGMLRKGLSETWPQETHEMTHVKFSFMWNAFTDPFDFDTDIYPGCLASAIAREKWSKEYFERVKKSHQTHYEQWGELLGTIQVDGHKDTQLRLRGYRDHSYGVRDWYTFHRYAINFVYLEDGTAFHVDSISLPGILSLLQCGYLSKPNGIMYPVSSTDMDMIALGEDQNPPTEYEFNFTADGKSYHVILKARAVIRFYLHDDWRSMIFEHVSDYEVNGVKGYGIFEFLYRNPSRSPLHPEKTLALLKEPDITASSSSSAIWLPFAATECGSSRLVGGKGCQLALLSQLKSAKFSVPSGFCLTIAAFHLQLASSPSQQMAIDNVVKVSCAENANPEVVKAACEAVADAFLNSPICPEVTNAVNEALCSVFGSNHAMRLFAVRSSAAGEDGVEMSAAGQMETVLGVTGLEKIYEAIKFCWASLYAYTAFAYRKQNCQQLKSSAGVVIQEMVSAAAAGVLFTRHPVTGNPGEMVLNANYGLGESVVSGEADPDQVTISRDWTDAVSIKRKQIGSKKLQMKLTNCGVENIVSKSSDTCCIGDDLILQLASVGIELEKRFGNPRDIEFAIDAENRIQLLQARPITVLEFESEWHLLHEFDTALANDKETLTTANIQEMMPSAVTPLTCSTFFHFVDRATQSLLVNCGVHPCVHYPQKSVYICCNQGFINLNYSLGLYEGTSIMGQKRMGELSLLGEVVNKPLLADHVSYNGRYSLLRRIRNGIMQFWAMYNSSAWVKRFGERMQSYTLIKPHLNSPHKLYHAISKDLPLFDKMWSEHVMCSSSSAVYSNVIMAIVSEGADVWRTEHYSDLAMLLSKCDDVYSADVPSLLLKLVENVRTKEERDKMINSSPEEVLDWLKLDSSGEIGREFTSFMSRHGHRCIREAEFREKSWHMEPTKVIKVLQSMAQSSSTNPTGRNAVETSQPSISRIKSHTTLFSRLVLRFIWPKARRGVGSRETSKSIAVQLIDAFKQGYWKLAEMMVEENRLPDQDLLFFFTHREIGILLETRSPRLIARAQKRRHIHSKQSLLRFQRITTGHPALIDTLSESKIKSFSSMVKASGLPVSLGVTMGTARVVRSLAEASSIQNGDILIVEYTDVGWSPYFPLISGLVTEIGGLVSHGAVVAREYGLPCVVNVANATRIFNSGEKLILDGNLGTIEKVKETDN